MARLKSGTWRNINGANVLVGSGGKVIAGRAAIEEYASKAGIEKAQASSASSGPHKLGKLEGLQDLENYPSLTSALSSTEEQYGAAGTGDRILGAILRDQGFDAKPKLATADELDDAASSGGVKLHRGVQATNGRTAAEIQEQFRSGELYPGNGIYGNGTYMARSRGDAASYSDDSEGSMLKAVLPSTAKMVAYDDLQREISATYGTPKKLIDDAYEASLEKTGESPSSDVLAPLHVKAAKLKANLDAVEELRDPGRYAALKGYDAIFVEGKGKRGSDYYVILNRGALLVERS